VGNKKEAAFRDKIKGDLKGKGRNSTGTGNRGADTECAAQGQNGAGTCVGSGESCLAEKKE